MSSPANAIAAIVTVRRGRSPWRYRVPAAAILAAAVVMTSGGATSEKSAPRAEMPAWRHTQDGWERPRWTTARQPPCPVPLHPLYPATLTILLTAMALLGHTPRPRAALARRQRYGAHRGPGFRAEGESPSRRTVASSFSVSPSCVE